MTTTTTTAVLAFVQRPIQITLGCKSQRWNFRVAPPSVAIYNPPHPLISTITALCSITAYIQGEPTRNETYRGIEQAPYKVCTLHVYICVYLYRRGKKAIRVFSERFFLPVYPPPPSSAPTP